LTSDISKPD